MIRSMIGFACVLFFMTTCIQSSAAQPCANFNANPLRSNVAPMSLRVGTQTNFRAISDSILSSDAYHDDFRFRAAPVKRSANWQMPIVDVKPAKQIVVDFIQPTVATENAEIDFNFEIARLSDLVRETANRVSAEYCQFRDRFEEITLAVIPRPIAVPKGQADYWNYYADCDRWNVVFAIAWQREAAPQAQENDFAAVTKFTWDDSAELIWENAVASWEASWKDVAAAYQRVARQFSVSRR